MNIEILETKRLILKGFSPSNMAYVFENLSTPEIKKILGHRSEEEFQKEKNKHESGYSSYNRSFKLFLLTDKASDTVIGRCGFHNWNDEHKRAEIGYAMQDENYKRKGLMTEALDAIIEFGFTKMNLHRIEALVGVYNTPSLKLLERHNFIKEGVLREHYYTANNYEDSVMFSKLYHEYSKEKNKQ